MYLEKKCHTVIAVYPFPECAASVFICLHVGDIFWHPNVSWEMKILMGNGVSNKNSNNSVRKEN
jgi:hypothetical protein